MPAIEALLQAPLDVVRRWTEREEQVWASLRTPGSDLRLWLQWDVPGLDWHDVSRDEVSCGCLHHVPHQTLILLDPQRRTLELRGDGEVWTQVARSLRRWTAAGEPGRTSHQLVVRDPGGQFVACGGEGPPLKWRLT
jgi:hypothetical protein